MAKRSLNTTAKRVKSAAKAVEPTSLKASGEWQKPPSLVTVIVGEGGAGAAINDQSDEALASELPEGPMSIDDVIAVLADRGITSTKDSTRGNEKGLTIPVPGGSITVERVKVKKCSGMDELREYVYGML
jgi:hypothetical protein